VSTGPSDAVYRDAATHELLDYDDTHGRFDNDMLDLMGNDRDEARCRRR
jgi:hypothetical protein